MIRRPPSSPLFPSTPLFRSVPVGDDRSRQFEVRVTLANPQWLVGTPVEVGLPSSAQRTAVTVPRDARSEEHTSELQSPCNLVCRLLLEKKKQAPRALSTSHR